LSSTTTTIPALFSDFTVKVAVDLTPEAKIEVVKKKEVKRVEIVFILFIFCNNNGHEVITG
jgi:hypothetical protein